MVGQREEFYWEGVAARPWIVLSYTFVCSLFNSISKRFLPGLFILLFFFFTFCVCGFFFFRVFMCSFAFSVVEANLFHRLPQVAQKQPKSWIGAAVAATNGPVAPVNGPVAPVNGAAAPVARPYPGKKAAPPNPIRVHPAQESPDFSLKRAAAAPRDAVMNRKVPRTSQSSPSFDAAQPVVAKKRGRPRKDHGLGSPGQEVRAYFFLS